MAEEAEIVDTIMEDQEILDPEKIIVVCFQYP